MLRMCALALGLSLAMAVLQAGAQEIVDAADAADGTANQMRPEAAGSGVQAAPVPLEEVQRANEAYLRLLESADEIIDSLESVEAYLSTGPGPAQGMNEEALELTVEECVAMALSANAKVFVTEADVAAAQARIGQVRAQLFPQVTGRIAWTHTEFNERDYGSGLLGLLGGGTGTGGTGGIGGIGGLTGNPIADLALSIGLSAVTQELFSGIGPRLTPDDDLISQQVTLTQVIYAGGQIKAAIRASRALAESQEWQKAASLLQLEYDTKQAYYDALLAEALVRVATESVSTFNRNLSDAQHMLEAGIISPFEVTRAQTELGARETDAVTARNAHRLALANLRRILFVAQDEPIRLTPRIAWEPPAAPVQHYADLAMAQRPELLALQKSIVAAEEDLTRVKGTYKPQVAATAEYKNTDNAGATVPDGWTFNLGAEWELAAGGRRKYERAESRATIESLQYQLKDLEKLVELDVTRAYIQIEDAMAKIRSQRGIVDLAQEGLRLAELRFIEGVGTQAETLDAELALTNAETQLIQALRDYAVAQSALERATGQSWEPERVLPQNAMPIAVEPAGDGE